MQSEAREGDGERGCESGSLGLVCTGTSCVRLLRSGEQRVQQAQLEEDPEVMDEAFERQHSRDYLWKPLSGLLDGGEIRQVLNLGGASSGEWIHLVERYDLRLHVIDRYEGYGTPGESIRELRDSVCRRGLGSNVVITRADALDYDYLGQTYDLVYARNSLHHMIPHGVNSCVKVARLFGKLSGALRSGGYFYIREAGRLNVPHLLLRPLLPSSWREMGYRSKTNSGEWICSLQAAGFDLLERRFYVPYRLRRLRRLLANRAANPFLTSAYMLLARRRG